MSRGRNKLPPAEKIGPKLGRLTEQAAADEAVVQGATEQLLEQSETLVRVGRIQTYDLYQKLSRVGAAKEFERVRESKSYKGLPYLDADGKVRHVGHLDEFCEIFLGRSYQRIAEDLQNLTLLGDELYEQALMLGLTTRDFRDIRRLPPSDQALVKEAINAQSRDAVIEIMESLIAKHAGEKEQLQKQVKNLEADLEAQRQVSSKRNEKIDQLEAQLERRAKLPAEELFEDLLADLNREVLNAGGAIYGIEKVIHDIVDRDERTPDHVLAACNDALVQLVKRVYQIATNQFLPLDLTELRNELYPEHALQTARPE